MSRPKKATVDYFSHDCNHKQTMFILESRYGNDGYAFWFKLLETLGNTEGHVINCRNEVTQEFLQAKTRLEWSICHEMLDLLAKLQAIDPNLWSEGLVWSDNFISRIADVYKNRRVEIPTKPSFYRQKPEQAVVSTDRNPQSKVKESKVKETKLKDIYCRVVAHLNNQTGKCFKPSSKNTKAHINARISEGFTEEDFYTVINKKVVKWLNDEKMAAFLRPETLFGTKFESYLNETGGGNGSCGAINSGKNGKDEKKPDYSAYDEGAETFQV
jgi:uncharacterized phage protein (TIGR02220 family)